MVVKDQNVEIYQGNRRRLIFTVQDEEGPGVKDLTGLNLTFAVARMNDEGVPLKKNPVIDHRTTDTPAQLVVTDPANGVVEFTFLCPDTESLAAREYYWELEAHDATCGVVLATGTLTVLTNVNNA